MQFYYGWDILQLSFDRDFICNSLLVRLIASMALTKPVRGCENFVWFTGIMLGSGAMGNVHLGRHRKKGTTYAVKVFKPETKMMTHNCLDTELEILKLLPPHDNIVKFTGVEYETYSRDKVVIMELCEGGSLQQIIDKPENYFGLQEDEFLRFFFDIGKALKHLFDNNIIHRDVKPGNVLLHINTDGSHVYKLTDFGTAKKMEDDVFKSLCGTEEYLHPKMHCAAFIKRIPGQVYNHSVDLWSYAVSVYQCACGTLPFAPREGIRQNKPRMQELMSTKEAGVISQVENADGTVDTKQHLPDSCQLSSGTMLKITNILRKVFDIKQSPSPRNIFGEIEVFSLEIKLHVFVTTTGELITVYLMPARVMEDLKQAVAAQTNIKTPDQLLFWENKYLHDVVDNTESISEYPETSNGSPIYVLDRKMTALTSSHVAHIPPAPAYVAPPGEDLLIDAKWARKEYGAACYTYHNLQIMILKQTHILHVRDILREKLKSKSDKVEHGVRKLKDMGHILELHRNLILAATHTQNGTTNGRVKSILEQLPNHSLNLESMLIDLCDIAERVKSLMSRAKKNQKPKCATFKCIEKAKKMLDDGFKMYDAIKSDRRQTLAHNEMEIHKFHMSGLKRHCRTIHELREKCAIEHLAWTFTDTLRDIRGLMEVDSKLSSTEEEIYVMDEQQTRVLRTMLQTHHSKTELFPKKAERDITKTMSSAITQTTEKWPQKYATLSQNRDPHVNAERSVPANDTIHSVYSPPHYYVENGLSSYTRDNQSSPHDGRAPGVPTDVYSNTSGYATSLEKVHTDGYGSGQNGFTTHSSKSTVKAEPLKCDVLSSGREMVRWNENKHFDSISVDSATMMEDMKAQIQWNNQQLKKLTELA